ncbi:hypothetical protein DSM112329_01521 [Paraconexibacter sp. AEG42_29]|uniref:Uncharacterized protein n=1 Tax=Paraconexibacter sp. AEG42_29 TaxID=2997339 RepID=A0AAU7AST2_9ACTN
MQEADDEVLEVDGIVEASDSVPALAPGGASTAADPVRPVLPVIAQAAAVATAGFAAGAVTVAVVRAVQGRKALGSRRRRRGLPRTSVVATRSFLIDVHVLETRERT